MARTMTLPSADDHTGRDLGREELALLREVIESGTLNSSRGTQVKAFERAFAARHGVPHARAVTSGTAAIHAALAVVDPEPGDEIITTAITDMGAIAPILFQQAIPIFADVDPATLNVTPETIAARITPRTRAIVATHLFGNPCDVVGIARLAIARGIPVIEDCSQSFLATQHGQLVGTIGRMGAFSLHQSAHMTTGEGGVLITSDDGVARTAALFRDKGWGRGDPDPDHYILGLNYRMTELHGAVARAQLQKLTRAVRRRRRTAERLTEQLADVPGLTLPEARPGSTHVYWRYALGVDPAVVRGGTDALATALRARGVPCEPHYLGKPPFLTRAFTERKTYGRSRCPFSCRVRDGGSEIVYDAADYPGTMRGLAQTLVLPWNELYTDEHVRFIAHAVEDAVRDLTPRATYLGRAHSHETLQ